MKNKLEEFIKYGVINKYCIDKNEHRLELIKFKAGKHYIKHFFCDKCNFNIYL